MTQLLQPAPPRGGGLSQWLLETYARLEQRRVRQHHQAVERELREHPTTHLPDELQRERIRNLDRLHDYWVRGRFPCNTESRYWFATSIKDPGTGSLCAVAQLVADSGRLDIVDELATTQNNVRVRDVREGPLLDWLAESGLTQQEAAHIQMPYMPMPFESVILSFMRMPNLIALVTLLAAIVMAGILWSKIPEGRLRWAGVLTGRGRWLAAAAAYVILYVVVH